MEIPIETKLYLTKFVISTFVLMNQHLYLSLPVMTKLFFLDVDLDRPHFLTGDDAPFCIVYNEYFTVKHFLLECHGLAHVRDRFYRVNLFVASVPSNTLIDYLKK
jgi:hypothetical protein